MFYKTVVVESKMCEKRIRKNLKKGSHATRLREARRNQRLQRMAPAVNDNAPPAYAVVSIDKDLQNKLIIELAWRTVGLMEKNKLIQQKILDLQKETSDFVTAILQNPANRQRYIDYMTSHGYNCPQDTSESNKENVPKEEPMT